ncbi:heavy-metal-associated domain-containing protein, partial [Acidobacteria bacterium AH-259-O06]|nr:heavy-metal-associated domain-containing protein [Acidobacteria bacterium AH-259-O06]
MSKLLITVVAVAVLVSFGLVIGRAEASSEEGLKAEPRPSKKSAVGKEFFVAGMACAGCANSATELLEKIPGVHQA